MYDENQIVQIRWERGNKKRYELSGYVYTKIGDVFDISVKDLARSSKVKITAVCDYCGCDYKVAFGNLINSRKIVCKDACVACQQKKKSEVLRYKNSKKLLERAKGICEESGCILLTTEEDYIDSHMTVKIKCEKHGIQSVTLWALLKNKSVCPICGHDRRVIKNTLSIDYVEQYINSINGNILLNKGDYKTKKTHNLKIRCSCGNIYTTSLACYELGTQQCFSCSCKESAREREIRNILEFNKINFVQEKKFNDCKDTLPLPFDFYLPDYNLCIEFDGQHHYENVFGEKHYEMTKQHDKIKNQYCKDNNINLLRIPYWDGNNIEDIISKQLNL